MQKRAARTRRTLVSAAACEFDRSGYAGASLVRIARSAGISVGALTFHFSSKEQLAEVVRAKGHEATVALVERVRARQEAPLESVVTLTLGLAGLLEADLCVRAAARLTRDLPGCTPDWKSAWVPAISEYLRRLEGGSATGPVTDSLTGSATGPLTDSVSDPAALTVLATHLVAGVEADLRRRAGQEQDPDGRTAAQLARIWELVLGGRAGGSGGFRSRGAD
ncbi:TetR family transcriptional regulator [Streptomyces sp. NPDC059443]|uniref:TetR family transcriptional regulator n=1 Tax=unclassified Streptomyces TaxID=2593676 RepID=UPI00367C69F3